MQAFRIFQLIDAIPSGLEFEERKRSAPFESVPKLVETRA